MFTSNKEFYQYVIDATKLPYDTQLLNIVSKLFYNSLAELEKQIDFNFQRKTEVFSVLKGSNSINLPFVKSITKVIDKTHKYELIGMPYTDEFYLLYSDREGKPKYYIYSDDAVKFNLKVSEDTEFVVSYDRFYYLDPSYIGDDNLHPLVTENPDLLEKTLKTKIYEYMEDTENLTVMYKLKEKQKKDEQATQQLKRYKKTKLIIGLPRY